MTTVADRLGAWVSGLTAQAVPASILQQAVRCITDVVGVSLAGSVEMTARAVQAHVASEYAPGPCTLLGRKERFAPSGAALANGAAAHVLDYDDTCYVGIVHGSAVVWPAVLAAGEAAGISGHAALVAFVAGCEVEYALGRALANISYWKGWWNTAVLGAIGAAAGAARALNLDARTTNEAIRIATCQVGGMRSVLGTSAKPYLCGRAAQTGVAAALCARAGLAGPPAAIEHPYGLATLLNDNTFLPGVLDDLGKTFALETPGVAIKLYPFCSAAQAAMEATLEILEEHRLELNVIESVHCEVTPLVKMSLVYDQPRTPTECQFSMPFAISCILVFHDLRPDMLNVSTLADPRVSAAMRKVSMSTSDALGATERDQQDHPEAAIITIVTRDEQKIVRRKDAATGMPVNPMPDARLRQKFRMCAGRVLAEEHVSALLGRLTKLQELDGITGLFSA